MNRTALTSIAPDIYRQRLMVEGYFMVPVFGDTIRDYFQRLTGELALGTYGDPVSHRTGGQGRALNEGFDYTCGPFDADQAIRCVRDSFALTRLKSAVF